MPAGDWIGVQINTCRAETVERFNRISDELDWVGVRGPLLERKLSRLGSRRERILPVMRYL